MWYYIQHHHSLATAIHLTKKDLLFLIQHRAWEIYAPLVVK